MNKEINMRTLCTGVNDKRANDKGAISQFLSDTSANASGSVLYLYERMNARRCKISFLCTTLWVGENRKIERGRLQLNLASLSKHGSVNRGGSRIFSGRGALVSWSTSTPINHIVFFAEYQLY